MTAWLALLDTLLDPGPPYPDLSASAGPAVLAGWRSARTAPHAAARRIDPRLLDPDGATAWVSLVWPDPAALPLFDDPAVVAARRAAQHGDAPRAVSTLVVDSTHFAGSIWVVDHPVALRDDPFRVVATPTILPVGAGLLGRVPRPFGPALERYSGVPWPWDGT